MLPLIKALGKQDPAAALALAKRIRLGTAGSRGLPTEGRGGRIIRDVFNQERNRTIENLAKVNAIDPQLAKELYTEYKATWEADLYNDSRHNDADSATLSRVQYAYLISSLDPVEARLLLETTFAETRNQLQPKPGPQYQVLSTISLEMCALDLERSRQMCDAFDELVSDAFHRRDQALRRYFNQQLIQYILMPRAERVSAMVFD